MPLKTMLLTGAMAVPLPVTRLSRKGASTSAVLMVSPAWGT